MARTKQTARKSTGGKAPRKQLATQSARNFRSFMTSQQAIGSGVVSTGSQLPSGSHHAKGVSFINYENTLGGFKFPVGAPENAADFVPRFEAAVLKDPVTGIESPYMSVNFASRYDDEGMAKIGRPNMDLVIVLDISGSMSTRFSNDSDEAGGYRWGAVDRQESKLGVAIRCIKAIVRQLTPTDQLAIVLFNTDQHTLQSLAKCSTIDVVALEAKLDAVQSTGGTDLHKGFKAGLKMLAKSKPMQWLHDGMQWLYDGQSKEAMSRVMFMTDMESGIEDENAVLSTAKKHATKKQYTTVVGVGVDLSVGTVQKLSAIQGCKYTSVSSASEFEETILTSFAHDVTPVAFDIKFALGEEYTFVKGFGSPEVNGIPSGSTEVKLSSEFPIRTNADRTAYGALVFKLQAPPVVGSAFSIVTTWRGMDGKAQSHTAEVALSPAAECICLRKAVAIIGYVDVQSDYVLVDEDDSSTKQLSGQAALRSKLEGHSRWVERLDACKLNLLGELRACGDDSVEEAEGTNSNIRQTIDQMISFEKTEITQLESKIKPATAPASGGKGAKSRSKKNAVPTVIPDEFRCPITREEMTDPVVMSDGHTYDRDSIEQWIAQCSANGGVVVSPLTNRGVRNTTLVPNHALRKLIEDHRTRIDSGSASAMDVDAAAAVGSAVGSAAAAGSASGSAGPATPASTGTSGRRRSAAPAAVPSAASPAATAATGASGRRRSAASAAAPMSPAAVAIAVVPAVVSTGTGGRRRSAASAAGAAAASAAALSPAVGSAAAAASTGASGRRRSATTAQTASPSPRASKRLRTQKP